MGDRVLEKSSLPPSQEPLYWGSVEVVSFLCLFLSPWLGDRAVEALWLSLVFWRTSLVGAWLLTCSTVALKRRGVGLATGLAYGAPFWLSALLFPVRHGQAEVLFPLLGLYLGLVSAIFLLSLTKRAWYAAQMALLTALWFYRLEPNLLTALGLLFALLPLLWKGPGQAEKDWEDGRWALLLATGGWCFCLLLAELGGEAGLEPLARGLMVWLVVAGVSQQAVEKARKGRERACGRELEFSLPDLTAGLSWLHRQELRKTWAPWAVLVPLAVWDEMLGWVALLAVLAFYGLIAMTAKGFVSSLQLQWWVCGQFVVIWGAVEGQGPYRFGWLLVAFLLTFALQRSREVELGFETGALASRGLLECELRRELLAKAPEDTPQEVMRAVEPSVDIDVSLSAEAPAGFRQRLLQRLKHAENDHDEES